jgi:hypothetical protein
MFQSGLDDDVRALTHRGDRIGKRSWTCFVYLDDALPQLLEVLHVGLLVLQAAFPKDLEHWVIEERPLRELVRRQPLEHREMPAPKEVGQIGGEVEWTLTSEVHRSP